MAPGGAERLLVETVARLDRARFEPIIACQKGPGPLAKDVRDAGAELVTLTGGRRFDLRFISRLWRLCRQRCAATLVSYGVTPGVVARVVGRSLGIRPVIVADHGFHIGIAPWREAIERRLAPLTDRVVICAESQRRSWRERGHPDHSITFVGNGIDLTEWRPSEPDASIRADLGVPEHAPIVGMVAGFRPMKDHDTYIRAVASLDGEAREAHHVLVGDGPLRTATEDLTRDLGVADRVHFVGLRRDVARWVSSFAVSVLIGTDELLPIALLESMAMGVPVIGTRVGGVPALIDEDETGWLVPPRSPSAVARALSGALTDREQLARMGRRARTTVEERYDIDETVRQMEALLS